MQKILIAESTAEQSRALQLADALADYTGCTLAQMDQAAAELRRLHSEIERERESRQEAQNQLYAEREHHTNSVKALERKIGRLSTQADKDEALLRHALEALRQCRYTSPPAQRPMVVAVIAALIGRLEEAT